MYPSLKSMVNHCTLNLFWNTEFFSLHKASNKDPVTKRRDKAIWLPSISLSYSVEISV